jgi:hypothetical protein
MVRGVASAKDVQFFATLGAFFLVKNGVECCDEDELGHD